LLVSNPSILTAALTNTTDEDWGFSLMGAVLELLYQRIIAQLWATL